MNTSRRLRLAATLGTFIVFGGGALLAWTGNAFAFSEQRGLEHAASALIRGPIVVKCASKDEEAALAAQYDLGDIAPDGWSFPGTRDVYLAADTCTILLHYADSPLYGFGVHVLAHELGHVTLTTRDETTAECYAVKYERLLARKLGHPLTKAQLIEARRGHTATPPEYRARPCGGLR